MHLFIISHSFESWTAEVFYGIIVVFEIYMMLADSEDKNRQGRERIMKKL